MLILENSQILLKIDRIAIEILENKINDDPLIFVGINVKGLALTKLVHTSILKILPKTEKIEVLNINIDVADFPKSGILNKIYENVSFKNARIILFDDVVNTGRTIFYCFREIVDILPSSVEVAVLVDRKHKIFPVHVNYKGLSLATTLKENIEVDLQKVGKMKVELF